MQAWLYKITLNVFYARLGKPKFHVVSLDVSEDSAMLEIEDDWHAQPEAVVESAEFLREMEALMLLLPERQREVINLYYFAEFSYREIAGLLDQPLGTVKSQLHRGMQMLRQATKRQKGEVS